LVNYDPFAASRPAASRTIDSLRPEGMSTR